MLLIDGVRYEEWTDLKETEDLEPMIQKHAKYIFGENALYIDRKQKLRSLAGTGSIPDAYVISLGGDSPHWHIVEIELSYKDPSRHLVTQINDFINGMKNSRNVIVSAINQWIKSDNIRALEFKRRSQCEDIHEFLSDLIKKDPILTIIIEKNTEKLKEAIQIFEERYKTEIVEFRTFRREGAEAVHAHLFSPLREGKKESEEKEWNGETGKDKEKEGGRGRRVTFNELISAGLLRDGQVLYFYHTRPFTNERAQVIASSNQLKYEGDGRAYAISELAKILFPKYGFKEQEVQGPKYWKTEDGKLLHDLNEQIRKQRGDRT